MKPVIKVIRMSHTDTAGRVFTPQYFELAHEGFEEALSAAGISFKKFLDGTFPPMPVVHAEADFTSPLYLGDEITLEVQWSGKGQSSVESKTVFRKSDGSQAAVVTFIHVFVDPETGSSTAIPKALEDMFTR